MPNVRLLNENLIDDATVTASSEVSTLPKENVQDTILKRVWRTTGLSDQWIAFDLGQVDLIRAAALFHHNLSSEAQYTVIVSDNPDFSEPSLEQTFDAWEPVFGAGEGGAGEHGAGGYLSDADLAAYKRYSFRFFEVEGRYVKIEFSDPDNGDGYIQVGRVYLGDFFEPINNFDYGWSIEEVDSSTVDVSLGGVKWSDLQETFRRVVFRMSNLDNSEKQHRLLGLQRRLGVGRDFILCLFPDKDSTDWYFNTMYGRLQKTFPISNQDYLRNTAEIIFEESV